MAFFNGNTEAVKRMVGGPTDSSNRAQASGLLPLVWALGVAIEYAPCVRNAPFSPTRDNPLLCGSLSHSHKRLPNLFGNRLWEGYPRLLPYLFSAVFRASFFVLTWLFLKEVRRFVGGFVKKSDRPPSRP